MNGSVKDNEVSSSLRALSLSFQTVLNTLCSAQQCCSASVRLFWSSPAMQLKSTRTRAHTHLIETQRTMLVLRRITCMVTSEVLCSGQSEWSQGHTQVQTCTSRSEGCPSGYSCNEGSCSVWAEYVPAEYFPGLLKDMMIVYVQRPWSSDSNLAQRGVYNKKEVCEKTVKQLTEANR